MNRECEFCGDSRCGDTRPFCSEKFLAMIELREKIIRQIEDLKNEFKTDGEEGV